MLAVELEPHQLTMVELAVAVAVSMPNPDQRLPIQGLSAAARVELAPLMEVEEAAVVAY